MVNDFIASSSSDICLLQEHWLKPANLDYFAFSFSAMNDIINIGCFAW